MLLTVRQQIDEWCENEYPGDEQGYKECKDSQWEFLNAEAGVNIVILVLGLFFATCAVCSSILCKPD